MMEEAEDWLAKEDEEESYADDGMCRSNHAGFSSHVNSHAERHDIEQVGNDLQCGMNPNQSSEVSYTDQDTTDGEQANESQTGQDTVSE